MAPPITEITIKHKRKHKSLSHESEETEQTNESKPQRPVHRSKHHHRHHRATTKPPVVKSRVKPVKARRRSIMARSEISSLTSWSSHLDDTTASSSIRQPTKSQDIFRKRTPPTLLSLVKKKKDIVVVETPQRPSTGMNDKLGTPQRPSTGVNDMTPLRHNRGGPAQPQVAAPTAHAAAFPPAKTPASSTTAPYTVSPAASATPSAYTPSVVGPSSNQSLQTYSTTGSTSLLGSLTKRAVTNVFDNYLFEDEVNSVPAAGRNEVDSYLESVVADRTVTEDASQLESPPVDVNVKRRKQTNTISSRSNSHPIQNVPEEPNKVSPSSPQGGVQSQTLQESRLNEANTTSLDHTPPQDAKVPEENATIVLSQPDEGSYFDLDMDVSSLRAEDEDTTPTKKEMLLQLGEELGIRSLRGRKKEKRTNTAKEKESMLALHKEPSEKLADAKSTAMEVEAKQTEEEEQVSTKTVEQVLTKEDEQGSNQPHEEAQQDEVADDTNVGDNAKNTTTAEEEEAVSPQSDENIHVEDLIRRPSEAVATMAVVPFEPARQSDSWWQDDEHHDEEKATKSTKEPATEEEPITFRRTFLVLFLIVGVAALTGGMAAYLTSRHQRGSEGESTDSETGGPQSLSPVTNPPTMAPSIKLTTSTTQPTAAAPTNRPTAPNVIVDTQSPTKAPTLPVNLTLREQIELTSPESLPALEDPTSPQSLALTWALKQPTPSLIHFGLATLRYATNETTVGWRNDDGWLTPNVCGWYGIACHNNRVKEIHLSFNALGSSLPQEVSLLTDLQVLSISGSAETGETKGNLVGTIPPIWGERLSNLVALELYDNRLNGLIPSTFKYLTNLKTLNLNGNSFYGPIPAELGKLTSLVTLDLSSNNLSGVVPTEIGLLSNLSHLNLRDNELTGFIPTEIGSLKSMNELELHGNVLMGPIPRSLYSLTDLVWVDVSRNELSDILPPSIGLLSNLEGLLCQENRLGGPIPPQLSSLTHLRAFNVSKNALTGTVVSSLGTLTSLVELSLESNLLQGSVPDTLCDSLTKLRHFSYSSNCQACPCCTSCLN